jgi:hypothetical protein
MTCPHASSNTVISQLEKQHGRVNTKADLNFCGLKEAKIDSEQDKILLTFTTAQAGLGAYTDNLLGY